MRYARENDRRAPGPEPLGPPDLAPALGTWFNCNPRTGEIVRLELSDHGSGLRMRAFGANDDQAVHSPDGKRHGFGSPGRVTEYRRRVGGLAVLQRRLETNALGSLYGSVVQTVAKPLHHPDNPQLS